MPPSKGLFRKILSPLMWRRNYHPLSEDKLEEYLNDAERRDPSTILFFIFFDAPLPLRVRRHCSLHGSRLRRPHHLFGLPLPVRPVSADPAKLEISSTYINFDLL